VDCTFAQAPQIPEAIVACQHTCTIDNVHQQPSMRGRVTTAWWPAADNSYHSTCCSWLTQHWACTSACTHLIVLQSLKPCWF